MAKNRPSTKLARADFELLAGVELFRGGDYGTRGVYDEAKLDRMVADYNAAAPEAPTTLDHVKDGPAYGWLKKGTVKRTGLSIYGDLDLIGQFATTVKAGHYRQRSIEILRPHDETPRIRALTFLGAKTPEIALDPITFSEPGAPVACFELPSEAKFSMGPVTAPEGATFGTLCCEASTGRMLGHWHDAFTDDAGNGFTSMPASYGDEGMEYEGDHQHVISAGIVQAAGTPPHTHELTTYITKPGSTDATATQEEPAIMSTPAEPTADFAAKVADLESKVANFEAKMTAADTELAKRDARIAELEARNIANWEATQTARFEAAFSEGVKAGKVAPAEKDAQTKLFGVVLKAASATAKESADFAAAASTIDDLIASFASRAPVIDMGRTMASGRPAAPGTPEAAVAKFSADEDPNGIELDKAIKATIANFAANGKDLEYADAYDLVMGGAIPAGV